MTQNPKRCGMNTSGYRSKPIQWPEEEEKERKAITKNKVRRADFPLVKTTILITKNTVSWEEKNKKSNTNAPKFPRHSHAKEKKKTPQIPEKAQKH